MKRRVRERVIGVCAEDAGEEVEEVGREFMVVRRLSSAAVTGLGLAWP